jgi:WD40 repeat protein
VQAFYRIIAAQSGEGYYGMITYQVLEVPSLEIVYETSWLKMDMSPGGAIGLFSKNTDKQALFSPDGSKIAVPTQNGLFGIYDLLNERVIKEFTFYTLDYAAFFPDSNRMILIEDWIDYDDVCYTALYNIQEDENKFVRTNYRGSYIDGYADTIHISADGKLLMPVSNASLGDMCQIYEPTEAPASSGILCYDQGDGGWYLQRAGTGGPARVMDGNTGNVVCELEGSENFSFAASHAGAQMAGSVIVAREYSRSSDINDPSTYQKIMVWNAETGKLDLSFVLDDVKITEDDAGYETGQVNVTNFIRLSADGKRAMVTYEATAGNEYGLALIDTGTGKTITSWAPTPLLYAGT